MTEVELEAQAISAAEAAAIICGNFDDRKSLDSSVDLEKKPKAKEELTEEICKTPVVKKEQKRMKKTSESACSSGGRDGASSTPKAKSSKGKANKAKGEDKGGNGKGVKGKGGKADKKHARGDDAATEAKASGVKSKKVKEGGKGVKAGKAGKGSNEVKGGKVGKKRARDEDAGAEDKVSSKGSAVMVAKKEKGQAKGGRASAESGVSNGVGSVSGKEELAEEDGEVAKKKRVRTSEIEADGNADLKASNPSIDDFDISEVTKGHLRARDITTLFPIQAQTFDHIRSGKDLIGRARTGMGKTLAFALPVIEKCLGTARGGRMGREPRVLVMAPTRELAKQVASDFEVTGPSLKTTCIYGGSPYRPQEDDLRRGVDIVVGTPGRMLDHLGRETLRLSAVEFIILDEADQMLDMGFKEEMEKIFEGCGASNGEKKQQMLLFSATMPAWVDKVVKEYMKEDRVFIDLVKDGSAKASKDVVHVGVPCHKESRSSTINDVISVYGAGGNKQTILFCPTKRECNELCVDNQISYACQPLHGDLNQGSREATLDGFRKGTFKVLVATDVAARGLDMLVDLVVNVQPPSHTSGRADTEAYVHRSGRTGRAGRKGTCVTLYSPRQRITLGEIERHVGNSFQWRGAPQPSDIIGAAAGAAMEDIRGVGDSVLSLYKDAAEELISEKGATDALCAALACITGRTEGIPARSLLSNTEGYVTMIFNGDTPMEYVSYCRAALGRMFSPTIVAGVKSMQVSKDGMSCVFDMPEEHMDAIQGVCEDEACLEVCNELPALKLHSGGFHPGSPMRGGRGARGRGRGMGGRGGGRGSRGGGFAGRGRGMGDGAGGRGRGGRGRGSGGYWGS